MMVGYKRKDHFRGLTKMVDYRKGRKAMDKPSEATIAAYKWADYHRRTDVEQPTRAKPLSVQLADALRDERAGRLKAEFMMAHPTRKDNSYCQLCGYIQQPPEPLHPNVDKRHLITDWQSLAHRQLMGEE